MYVTEYVSFPVKQEKQRHSGLWSHLLMYFCKVWMTVMSLGQEEDRDRVLLMAQCCKMLF